MLTAITTENFTCGWYERENLKVFFVQLHFSLITSRIKYCYFVGRGKMFWHIILVTESLTTFDKGGAVENCKIVDIIVRLSIGLRVPIAIYDDCWFRRTFLITLTCRHKRARTHKCKYHTSMLYNGPLYGHIFKKIVYTDFKYEWHMHDIRAADVFVYDDIELEAARR